MKEFLGTIENQKSKIKNCLAAVSGGIDSMVMLHMLHRAGVQTVVAHCNFGLRGEESDLDECFVKTEAQKLEIQCICRRFDTADYAAQHGISIQMAARRLRYEWFNALCESSGFDAIAIAHNLDDSIETLFINLARGTSIKGMTGIKQTREKIIRPLLSVSRREIEEYAKKYNINFREDSSNLTDKYSRNYIRRNVIPGLEEYFPGVRQNIARSIENLSAVEKFYDEAIQRYKSETVTNTDDLVHIDLQKLSKSPAPATLLYEILKHYGFSNSTATDLLENQKNFSGRQFFSATHKLLHNRQTLVIQEIAGCMLSNVRDECSQIINYQSENENLEIEIFDNFPDFVPDRLPDVACLDCDLLQFPLILRNWEHGDVFYPLGMKNKKKLSDFFINQKLSIYQKEQCSVLTSDGKIAWVVGLRIDDRFKITTETTKICRLKRVVINSFPPADKKL